MILSTKQTRFHLCHTLNYIEIVMMIFDNEISKMLESSIRVRPKECAFLGEQRA